MHLWLPYGRKRLSLTLPEKNIVAVVRPQAITPSKNYKQLIEQALRKPINTKRLSELAEPNDKIAIVVDDSTRPSPTAKMLPLVVKELKNSGVKQENIVCIFANGTHEPVTPEEAKRLLGMDLRWINSREDEGEFVGQTTRGTKVKLSKTFIKADTKVLLGDVELHYYAGYGGGRKSILPGISSYETIQNNHKLMFHSRASLGNLTGNPVHLDMMEAYEMANVDFLLNVVQNPARQVVGAFGGSHDAFFEGVKLVDRMYKVGVKEKADIAIVGANGAPRDSNFYQTVKAIQTVIHVLKDKGVLVLVGECAQGVGSQKFFEDIQKYHTSDEVKEDLLDEFLLGRHKVYYLLKALEKVSVIMVSKMRREVVEKVFGMIYAPTINEALNKAFKLAGPEANILVSPYASTTMVTLCGSLYRR